MRFLPIVCLMLVAAVGCSAKDKAASSTAATSCSWPAAFDDAGPRACTAARMYLNCLSADGSGELCLSNDAHACPGPNPIVGETFDRCQNLCHPDEYGLLCGGPGPEQPPEPPANCRRLPSGPGGGIIACCPCGT